MACFATSFHPSHWPVASFPFNLISSLPSTSFTKRSRTGPERTRRSGTRAPGVHFAWNFNTCGLFAKFQEEPVETNIAQKSSANSRCFSDGHTFCRVFSNLDAGGDGELGSFTPVIFSNDLDEDNALERSNRNGFKMVDCKPGINAGGGTFSGWSASSARFRAIGETSLHLTRWGNMCCFGLPAIGFTPLLACCFHEVKTI